jgi:Spx/MgsR family transcriptional regulator
MIQFYGYPRCSTCQKALAFLQTHAIPYQVHSIVETPPSLEELKQMLVYLQGNLKKLFNTSGIKYRELRLGQQTLEPSEAFKLLRSDGMLIRRPFLLTPHAGTVGFKKETWSKLLRIS